MPIPPVHRSNDGAVKVWNHKSWSRSCSQVLGLQFYGLGLELCGLGRSLQFHGLAPSVEILFLLTSLSLSMFRTYYNNIYIVKTCLYYQCLINNQSS